MTDSQRTSFSSTRSQDLTLEIVRDPGVCGDWLNRYCKNVDTQEVMYYCDVYDDSNLEIHRGSKYGPVIAKSSTCRSRPGATDIRITDPRSNYRGAHIHHDENTSMTHFTENGHRYHWNRNQLVDDASGAVLAELSYTGANKRMSGKLTIKEGHDQSLTDPIVMTALIAQERSDEGTAWF